MDKSQRYIGNARTAAQQIWEGLHTLRAMQDEWTALDYGNTLPNGEDDNAGITNADVSAVVFTSANALKDLLDAGHATNIAKLLR